MAEGSDSERRIRSLQKLRLFLRRLAAERCVTVGEAAEALDDGAVAVGVVEILDRDLAELSDAVLDQREIAVLVGQRLAMLERQIEEHPVGKRIAPVEAARDRFGRD